MNNNGIKLGRLWKFTTYLQDNVAEHAAKAKEYADLETIENSILLLRDYTEVLDELMEVIDKYNKKTGNDF